MNMNDMNIEQLDHSIEQLVSCPLCGGEISPKNYMATCHDHPEHHVCNICYYRLKKEYFKTDINNSLELGCIYCGDRNNP